MSIDRHRRGRAAPEPGFTLCLLASEKEPVSRGSSRSVRAQGRSTPPAELTHDRAAAGAPGQGPPWPRQLLLLLVTFHSMSILASKSLQALWGWGVLERLGWGRAPEWVRRRRTEQPGVSRSLQPRYTVPTGWGAATPSPQAPGT